MMVARRDIDASRAGMAMAVPAVVMIVHAKSLPAQ
jgi:hypothetical protein